MPLMPQNVRARGGLVFHLLVSAYMFLGLSIVCDEYFVPALERMVECKLRSFPRMCYVTCLTPIKTVWPQCLQPLM